MSKTFSKHFYHGIWTTQNVAPIILPQYTKVIEQTLVTEFVELKCNLIHLLVMPDHVHCLFGYDGSNNIPFLYKNLKGAVSYHINSNQLIDGSLYWDKGYDSYSVSPSSLRSVVDYLGYQPLYHEQKTVQEELLEIRKSAGLFR